MEVEITLRQYKEDDYQDTFDGLHLKEIIIKRHQKVILVYEKV